MEVESVFGHIKGNRSFRRFSLRSLAKVQTEFGIVAMAHSLLKVAGLHQLLSGKNSGKQKTSREKQFVFLYLFFLGTY
ncbi:transposase [Peribacillus asahii]|uniref:transposase n=1 Tax=Peribacillus asahii TaxID=228899 RepID=UPI0037F2D0AF